MKRIIALLSNILIVISASNAPAATLFSNLGATEAFALSATTPGPVWASDFYTGPNFAAVTGITVDVSFSLGIGQSFAVRVAADDGSGQPGPVIGEFDTAIVVPAEGSGFHTANDGGIALGPNRRYWMLLEVATGIGGGSALSCTRSEDIDPGSLYDLLSGTGIMISFDGISYLPVQPGNLRFSLAGTILNPGAAILSVIAGPGAGGFVVRVDGSPGRTYRLQASSALSNGWVDIRSFTLTGSSTNIVDSSAVNFNSRFYRVVGD